MRPLFKLLSNSLAPLMSILHVPNQFADGARHVGIHFVTVFHSLASDCSCSLSYCVLNSCRIIWWWYGDGARGSIGLYLQLIKNMLVHAVSIIALHLLLCNQTCHLLELLIY